MSSTLLTCILLALSTTCSAAYNKTLWSFQYDSAAGPKWEAALGSARALTSQMTLEELNSITYGLPTTCAGLTGSVSHVGWDGLCYMDLGKSDLMNGYAEGISVGASWNVDLAYHRGYYLGGEMKRKGVKVALTPVIEPMGRLVTNGRNDEGFGADPYLAGKLSASTIMGLQESVISSVKHYIAYEQESFRNPGSLNNFSVSSNVNDRDMHELYLWAYQDAVAAGVGCVMCSYNRINGTYACENNATLNTLLKDELNFPGFVLSDWQGQHSGVASALGGLDVAMPSSPYWDQGQLAAAVRNGSLSQARLQDMATRQIAASYYVYNNSTSLPPNGYGLASDYLQPHPLVEARVPASKPNILQQAIEGHVLVKNVNNTLPLGKIQLMSLFGYDGPVQPLNYPVPGIFNAEWTNNVQGLNVTIQQIIEVYTGQLVTDIPNTATLGTYMTATGSGSSTPAYISDPYSAISQKAYEDDIYLWWNFQSYNPDVSAASQVCLVFINEASTEGADRPSLADVASDTLVLNVASKCANTVVVIHNVYIRTVDAFYNHPNVTAIIYAHLPGQDSGRALVKLLWGDVAPSGRLPYTVAKNQTDYGLLLYPALTPTSSPQSNFSNPSLFDYRYFQANNITPRFPFGFGLTYTTFRYNNVSATASSFLSAPKAPPNPDQRIPGGIKSLFDRLATVTVNVTNIGFVNASEVVQVYVQFPGETIHVLRGFQKRMIPYGQSEVFNIDLARRDLSRWDVASQQWLLPEGPTILMVGASSTDIKKSIVLTR